MTFTKDFNELDERSIFVNRICQLLYNMSDRNINIAILYGTKLFADINEYVRNVYELFDSEIPLIRYYELMTYGAENFGLSDEEYEKEISSTLEACKFYYEDSRWF